MGSEAHRDLEATPPRVVAGLTALLVAEVLALAAYQSPHHRFAWFAFNDSGAELVIQDLMARGYRPTVDFGFFYGLLPLLIGRLWYGIAGLTPTAFRIETLACVCLTAWGLARFAASQRVGPAGLALILLALPDMLLPSHITLVHSLEPALLTHALAEHARGRRGAALALATAGVFVKPSMAYLYGLWLLISIALTNREGGRAAWARALAPAAGTGAILAAILAATFGLEPLAHSLSPGKGVELYRVNQFGFFRGVGRDFWILPGAGLRDYFRYEVGFWLTGTLVLTWGGLVGAWRLWRGRSPGGLATNDEVVACCATLHLAFIALFFGHRGSWLYYFPILIMGLAAMAARGRWHAIAIAVLAAMLLVSDRSKAVETDRLRKTSAPSVETLGLWATPTERADWAKALEMTRGRRPVLLATNEGAALLFPGFAPPVAGYFIPGYAVPAEIRRKAEQLASASMIVSAVPRRWRGFEYWPELAAAMDGCELAWEGATLAVYRRVRPPSRSPGEGP